MPNNASTCSTPTQPTYAVFYDDRCSLCCRTMAFLSSIDRRYQLRQLPMNEPESLAPYPELRGHEEAMREGIHVLHHAQRTVWVGEEAVAVILKACGGAWWILGCLLELAIRLPLIGWGVRQTYGWVARNRYKLLARLGL